MEKLSLAQSIVASGGRGQKAQLFYNPKAPPEDLDRIQAFLASQEQLKDHFFFATSGSTADAKFIGLSSEALLCSARASAQHVSLQEQDRALISIPDFHVGGFGLLLRAALVGATCIYPDWSKWRALDFLDEIIHKRISVCSLVPTQVYDLVQEELEAPSWLRLVWVGGASIDEDLYSKARNLGWPLLPSFGMTEMGSQVATAKLESLSSRSMPQLRLLDHVTARVSDEGLLELDSKALFSGKLEIEGGQIKWSPRPRGYYQSQDCVRLELDSSGSELLKPLGRADRVLKISGERISLDELQEQLSRELGPQAKHLCLLARGDSRRGASILAVAEPCLNKDTVQKALDKINRKLLPPARIFDILKIEQFPRTELGKISWQRLRDSLRVSG